MSVHADEKSDEGIGPMKQPNKEGSPSAEAVEGRTSPEGNGGQAAAARTLRREAASNGLAAVRRAARQSKSVRFTALLHHITVDLLKQSYHALERDSAPGIDGVTWQAYGENLEEKLTDLHDRMHKGSYAPVPLVGHSSRRRTELSGRSPFCVWKTRSSSKRSRRFWERSTRRTSSGFPMGSGRGVASTMRWTHSTSVS